MLILPAVEEPSTWNDNDVYYWNHAALELNRLTHSLGGPHMGPTLSSRVLGVLHLALHDAWFALRPEPSIGTYLDAAATEPDVRMPATPPAAAPEDARLAMAGAAITVLEAHYARRNIPPPVSRATADQLGAAVQQAVDGYGELRTRSPAYRFGVAVANVMLKLLAIKPGEPGADAGNYMPMNGRYQFRDDPSNPVRLVPLDPDNPAGNKRPLRPYHAPYYGDTAKRLAVQMRIGSKDTGHQIADPPKAELGNAPADRDEYNDAVRDVIAMGGIPDAASTRRTPDQTAAALYWAYDGANLIGTPPRLYNQILRKVAAGQFKPGTDDDARTAEAARLFALVNAALGDAGIFSWREKYHFTFWRPLTGVREHDPATGPAYPGQPAGATLGPLADPFWQALGAPETNTDKVSFKPPFPAYPSGHATFGAAAFQMMRLYYRQRDNLSFAPDEPDAIAFDFVSDELNGVNRDLRQPYDPARPITDQPGLVRTRVVRRFPSLWAAMFENAISRIWLGVHWRFDAFAAADVLQTGGGCGAPYPVNADGTTAYRPVDKIRYTTMGPRDGSGEYPVGGVPLGIGIAEDIFGAGLKPTPKSKQPGIAASVTAPVRQPTTAPQVRPALRDGMR